MSVSPDLMIVAGEASGDLLGANLIMSLYKINPNLKIVGVGGQQMQNCGLVSLIPLNEIALMGFKDVITNLIPLYKTWQAFKIKIKFLRPKVIVTIDAPGFNKLVAKYAKKLGIPVVHYVAPSVWAWRPGRAKKLAKVVDHVLCLLPFEPPYFLKHKLAATFVGHSLIETILPDSSTGFRKFYNIAQQVTLITLLPGSRFSEILTHLPLMLETLKLLQQDHLICAVIVCMSEHRQIVEYFSKTSDCRVIIVDHKERWYAFMESAVAIAVSGTVSLELAYASIPQLIIYKTSKFNYYIAKQLIKIKWASLINILNNQAVVTELLQNQCTVQNITHEIKRILNNPAEQKRIRVAYAKALAMLKPPAPLAPSELAAQIVLKYLK